MKKNTRKKVSAAILSLAIVLSSVFAVSAAADTETGTNGDSVSYGTAEDGITLGSAVKSVSELTAIDGFNNFDFSNGLVNFGPRDPGSNNYWARLSDIGITTEDGMLKIDYKENSSTYDSYIGLQSVAVKIPESIDLTGKKLYVNLDVATLQGFNIRVLVDGVGGTWANINAGIGDVTTKTLANLTASDFGIVVSKDAKTVAIEVQTPHNADAKTFIDNIKIVYDDIGGMNNMFAGIDGSIVGDWEEGDANADKTVDIRDLVRVKKYTADKTEPIYYAAAKIDKNTDELGASDIAALRKKLLEAPAGNVEIFSYDSNQWMIENGVLKTATNDIEADDFDITLKNTDDTGWENCSLKFDLRFNWGYVKKDGTADYNFHVSMKRENYNKKHDTLYYSTQVREENFIESYESGATFCSGTSFPGFERERTYSIESKLLNDRLYISVDGVTIINGIDVSQAGVKKGHIALKAYHCNVELDNVELSELDGNGTAKKIYANDFEEPLGELNPINFRQGFDSGERAPFESIDQWYVTDGVLKPVYTDAEWQSGFEKMIFVNDSTWIDYTAEMDLKFNQSKADGRLNVFLRESPGKYYLIKLYNNQFAGENHIEIGNTVNTIINPFIGFENGKLYRVSISIKDYKIQVFIDGKLIAEGTAAEDKMFPNGRFGISASNADIEIDNVRIYSPSQKSDNENTGSEWYYLSSAPTVDTLLDSSERQERWLSIPDSRLVINPYVYSGLIADAKLQYDTQELRNPKMSLNVGYLDPELTKNSDKGIDGVGMTDSVIMFEKKTGGANEANAGYTTTWQPHKLSFAAAYDGGNRIAGEDFFYDEKTIVRKFSVTGSKDMVIGGKLYGKANNVTISENTIVIPVNDAAYGIMNVAITIQGTEKINRYYSEGRLKSGKACTAKAAKYWGATVSPTNGKADIVISYAVDKDSNTAKVLSQSPTFDSCTKRLEARESEWNNFFAKVPRAGDVIFTELNAEGVNREKIKQMYYESWSLIHASVLPVNPEMNYPYRQIATGKPSMWGHGAKESLYSAQWDSLYGMQMYSYVDPDVAWESFTGIMKLVNMSPDDPKTYGMILGESLPNVKSKTAWILYQNQPDKNKLANIYNELVQHEKWCMAHPNWIYEGNGSIDSDAKDSDYLAAALVDIPYLIRIARELGKTDDVNYWNKEFVKYLNSYYEWDGGANPNTLWQTKGLYISELKNSFEDKLMNKLKNGVFNDAMRVDHFDVTKPFCGFRNVKLDEIMFTIYGLMETGHTKEAHQLAESSVRDIVRANFLSEVYAPNPEDHGGDNFGEGRLLPSGVRPSVFGAVQLIDSIWLLNGFKYDSGIPTMHTYFGCGYIENLRMNGKVFNASVVGENVTLSGTYCKENKKVHVGAEQFYNEDGFGGEAPRYVDNTAETLAQWQDNTAQMDIVDGRGKVTVSSATTENYGYIESVVRLNTADFPIFTVDIDSCSEAQWALKCVVGGYGEDIVLISDNSAVGRTEINLLENGIPRSKNLSVTLKLFAIGKGEGKYVSVNGFEMNTQPLNIDFATDEGWFPSKSDLPITLTTAGNKGTFTLGSGSAGWGTITYYANINTIDNRYLVLDVESTDCHIELEVNGGAPKYVLGKTTGEYYIDMQAEDSYFERGVNVNTKLSMSLVGNSGQKAVVCRIYTAAEYIG